MIDDNEPTNTWVWSITSKEIRKVRLRKLKEQKRNIEEKINILESIIRLDEKNKIKKVQGDE